MLSLRLGPLMDATPIARNALMHVSKAAPQAVQREVLQRGGRPSKLTPRATRRIRAGWRAGLDRAEIARQARVNRTTLARWVARGKTDTAGRYAELHADLERLRPERERRRAVRRPRVAAERRRARKKAALRAEWREVCALCRRVFADASSTPVGE